MRVVSVNVGRPRQVPWRGRMVETGIFKEPVDGRVAVTRLGLAGDEQADLRVHGGPDKAVYAYPAEHYPRWEAELGRELPFGSFGENLTVEGLPAEDELAIGDRYRAGSALLAVTQPRLPCFKLGIRLGDQGMLKRFLRSGRTGCYLRVLEEGEVAAGAPLELVARDPAGVPVSELTRVYAGARDDLPAIERLLAAHGLPADWRGWLADLRAASA